MRVVPMAGTVRFHPMEPPVSTGWNRSFPVIGTDRFRLPEMGGSIRCQTAGRLIPVILRYRSRA